MPLSTAAAILGAGIIGGGAAILSSGESADIQAEAAKQGSDTLAQSTAMSVAEQRRQFDETKKMLEKQQALAQPYVQAGTAATGKLQGYLMGGAAGQDEFAQALRATPGYNFLQQEGQLAGERSLARMGLSQSGRAAQELQQRRMSLADTTSQGYMSNLMQLAGFGTQGLGLGNAAASGIASAGQATSGNIGSALQNLGVNQSNLLQAAGQARASSYGTAASEFGGMLGSLARFGGGSGWGGGSLGDFDGFRGYY
jgi:hypothetical protein